MKGDHMSLKIGEINSLTVNRKTDIGYMLESDTEQVFLHFNESNHEELKKGDIVSAFLYYDQKARLAATLKMPHITISKPGFLRVSAVHEELGVFLDMGISKELLLSFEDLPYDHDLWPKVDDILYVIIKIKSRFVAKIASKEEVKIIPLNELKLMDTIEARVQKIGKEGINLLTEEGHFIFVHHSNLKEKYRLGQLLNCKVTFKSEKGYTGFLGLQKEKLIYDDANIILSHLIRHGDLNLTSDSSPEEIKETFDMSKKAFKRALGTLYKDRKIDFVDNKTILVKK